MKVVAWNIGHRTREKPIPLRLLAAIASLAPDVLILNEFVDGQSRGDFRGDLERLGLSHLAVSPPEEGQNQVLMASRFPHVAGDLVPPTISTADAPNFLHRSFGDLEVVGVRVPFYKSRPLLVAYWDALVGIVQRSAGRRIVFLGDLNANPGNARSPGGRALAGLKQHGWQIPEPIGAWSYISHSGAAQSRIDFAILSPLLTGAGVRYLDRAGEIILAGPALTQPLSDHAALALEVCAAQPHRG